MAERLDKRLVLNEWLFSRLGYSDTVQGMKQVAKILRDEPVGVIKAKWADHLGHGRCRKENHRLTEVSAKSPRDRNKRLVDFRQYIVFTDH